MDLLTLSNGTISLRGAPSFQQDHSHTARGAAKAVALDNLAHLRGARITAAGEDDDRSSVSSDSTIEGPIPKGSLRVRLDFQKTTRKKFNSSARPLSALSVSLPARGSQARKRLLEKAGVALTASLPIISRRKDKAPEKKEDALQRSLASYRVRRPVALLRTARAPTANAAPAASARDTAASKSESELNVDTPAQTKPFFDDLIVRQAFEFFIENVRDVEVDNSFLKFIQKVQTFVFGIVFFCGQALESLGRSAGLVFFSPLYFSSISDFYKKQFIVLTRDSIVCLWEIIKYSFTQLVE